METIRASRIDICSPDIHRNIYIALFSTVLQDLMILFHFDLLLAQSL